MPHFFKNISTTNPSYEGNKEGWSLFNQIKEDFLLDSKLKLDIGTYFSLRNDTENLPQKQQVVSNPLTKKSRTFLEAILTRYYTLNDPVQLLNIPAVIQWTKNEGVEALELKLRREYSYDLHNIEKLSTDPSLDSDWLDVRKQLVAFYSKFEPGKSNEQVNEIYKLSAKKGIKFINEMLMKKYGATLMSELIEKEEKLPPEMRRKFCVIPLIPMKFLVIIFFLASIIGLGAGIGVQNASIVVGNNGNFTVSPTLSPTRAKKKVICKFTIRSAILEVFVGGVDYTDLTLGTFTDSGSVKTLEFDDDTDQSVIVFAIKGFNINGQSSKEGNGFQLRCSSIESPRWNIETSVNNWFAIESKNKFLDSFDNDWFGLEPRQKLSPVVLSQADFKLDIDPPMNDNSKIWIGVSNPTQYVAFRLLVR